MNWVERIFLIVICIWIWFLVYKLNAFQFFIKLFNINMENKSKIELFFLSERFQRILVIFIITFISIGIILDILDP